MKSILIPVEDHVGMNAVLETTLLFAQNFGSYMEGAALGPDLAEMVAADFSLGGVIFDERTRRELLDLAFLKFESFMLAHAVKRYDETSNVPSFGWLGDTLTSDNGIGEYGRVFDLVAVGRPGSGLNHARKATLEAALFESGRPLLIAPPRAPAKLGECVVIAWNGSSETARTVAFAMPLLVAARDVPIIMIPGTRFPGPSDEQLAKSSSTPWHTRPDGPHLRRVKAARYRRARNRNRARRRSLDQRRLYAEPSAPIYLRQRNRANSGRSRFADLHGALIGDVRSTLRTGRARYCRQFLRH